MNPAHLSDLRPRVALPAQDECLAANVLQDLGQEPARVDFSMSEF